MNKNKTIKIISYILIAISIPIFILSMVFFIHKESSEYANENVEVQESNAFVSIMMNELINYSRQLIYHQANYTQVKDGDITIFYRKKPNEYNTIQDLCVYIKYNDKIITNVELTSKTNTVQGIKEYIEKQDTKKLSIINGEVQSDTDSINKKAVQYFDEFDIGYYNSKGAITAEISKIANINEFEIYASYSEKIVEPVMETQFREFMKDLRKYTQAMYVAIPLCVVIVIASIIYLFYAIEKEKNELKWIDKLYYEILLIITVTLMCFTMIPFAIICDECELQNDLYFTMSIGITVYFVEYIICAVLFNSSIKRIMAKSFWKTTIIGNIVLFIFRSLKELKEKAKQNWQNFTKNVARNRKVAIYMIAFIILEIFLFLAFNFLGFLLDIILAIYVFNKVIKYIYSFEKIEDKLKNMYEGNNETTLTSSDVEKEFEDSVKYINDISNGFENAIKESLKSEKLKTELITNVSHDIKTPLTSIINYVDLLKQEEIENKKVKEYIEILDNKSQRLKKLTEDIVEASKASSGAIKLNIEKINIVELLKQSIGEFEDKFKAKELEVITKYSKEDIFINADSRYLYRVIENVFGNISKYALENSRVYIDVKCNNSNVKIEIKNISKEKLNISTDELMQRFVRGDKSRTTEGSGLGISIAKSLVELQKGKFELQIDGDLFKVIIEF